MCRIVEQGVTLLTLHYCSFIRTPCALVTERMNEMNCKILSLGFISILFRYLMCLNVNFKVFGYKADVFSTSKSCVSSLGKKLISFEKQWKREDSHVNKYIKYF